ncbi:MAG: carbon-nitrogen hydrolase family protein [Candidatus Auribacter fodinae]|jgi:predicted amidohydrolase|uniref:Carbon-nitrogen hydrolase family protein n=1 Tax=Candidatus Auribacter fodinae TaxID=2093366 RepID=A0A3A4QU26_9BACT|nr:MAG: carbon-nitrogen hydrolase family protein [Candidatus Auribacter fodinae]
MASFFAAAIQINSGQDIQHNLDKAISYIHEAAQSGASLVALPEYVLYIGPDKSISFSDESPEIAALCNAARRHAIFLLAGTIQKKIQGRTKCYNTSLLINPEGKITASYNKMHLFDVRIGDSREYNESSFLEPGSETACADTALGKIGLSICYDLRFPELYRILAKAGAVILCVPSNFAYVTGKDHWQVLLRARAIENTAFVIAPNQCGIKYDGNTSYGKSAIICPWGAVLTEASGSDEEIIYAQIDMDHRANVCAKIPSLDNMRIDIPNP